MPVRKKDGKWYWGGQGPFNSKKKAEEVAQAAYASGYTKKGWLTNPRGSTDSNKHEDAAEEERQQGFRYRKGMGGWGRGGQQEGTKPTIPRSKNRKLKKDMASGYGSGLNAQGDSLKRGAYWDQRTNNKKTGNKKEEHEESAVQKFLKYDQGRSINHPSYPPTHSGLLGPKRIDWKKKHKTPIDNTQPTEFVEKNVQKQVDLFEMPDFWLSKFIDINRQRGLAYILKQSEDEEEEEIDPSPEPDEPTPDEPQEDIDGDDEQDVDASAGVIQWDTETMGPLPPDRIPIRDVSQAPKGVRIIQGPRGGLYYLEGQGDTASKPPEFNRHTANFDRIRDSMQSEITKFENHDKAIENMFDKHMERLKAEHGLSKDDEEYVNKLAEAAMNDKEYQTFEKAKEALLGERRDFYREQRKPMAEAMNSLFKSFADNPQIEGLPVHINPDVTLQAGADFAQTFIKHVQDDVHQDFMMTMHSVPVPDPEKDYKEMTEMYVSGTDILKEFTPHLLVESLQGERKYVDPSKTKDARKSLATLAEGNMNDPRTGEPMTRDEMAYWDRVRRGLDYHEAYLEQVLKSKIERKHLGGYYLEKENVLALNPFHVIDLFGNDKQNFMDAMQTVSHELLHSGSHGETGRDRVNILRAMNEGMDNIRYSSDVTTSLYSNDEGVVEHSNKLLDHYKYFVEECPVELMSHIVLEDKYGISKKPKNREEAADLNIETSALGYQDIVPGFAKWMLAKHNDSPKAARKDLVAFLNTKDHNKLQEEYINYSAVHALSHKAATDEANNTNHRHSKLFKKHFGHIDLDKYEKGELKRMKPGATTEERPETIDMPDYIKYNKEALSKNTASMEDVKWLLYGERD